MDSVPSSSSPWAAAAGAPCCPLDALRRVCARHAARAAGWALGALLTCVFAVVGSLVGIFIGAFMGMSTESGMLRGAGVGAVSGAVFSIEAVESCIEIWRSSHSGKYSILFVLDIISSLFSGRIVWEKVSPALQRAVQSQMSLLSTPFIDNNDLFETGSTGGMSRDLIDRIPKMKFSAASNCDQETDSSSCSVCLQSPCTRAKLSGMMERKLMGQPISLDIKITQQGSTRSDTKFRFQVRTARQHQIDLAIFLNSGCCLRHMSTHWKDLEVHFQMDPTPLGLTVL